MVWGGLSGAPAGAKILLLAGASVLCGAALTPIARRLAVRLGAIDRPDERRIHRGEVPRLGGIAIFGTLLIVGVAGFFLSPRIHEIMRANPGDVAGFIFGAALVFAVGVYDDIRGANAVQKLSCQFAAGAAMFAAGCRIESLGLPGVGVLSLGLFSFPVTLLWIALVTNAMNLLDGLDGLAAGVSIVSLLTITLLGAGVHQTLPLIAIILLSATLGFLPSNFPPASIFMGDSGSMVLGFSLSVLAIYSSTKTAAATVLLLPLLLLLALPLLDAGLAIVRRLFRRGDGAPIGLLARIQSIAHADRRHIHHRLVDSGLSVREAVLLLYGLQILACGAAVWVLGTRAGALAGPLLP